MATDLKLECSICDWYPIFAKNSLEAKILTIPDQVYDYLQHGAFVLPVEATKSNLNSNTEWSDGAFTGNDCSEDAEEQPSFPEFSKLIQAVLDEYGAVFVKSNWQSPSDATWMAPTKSLKCTSLEDIYLLLKSSDRISADLSAIDEIPGNKNSNGRVISACLVLKRWRDVSPSTEFRCFVVSHELVGICQRDSSQYYQHIESEKYDIQRDITSLFNERIKNRFKLDDYSFDVIRSRKDTVKIVDFGALNESVTSGTLFSLEELLAVGTRPRAEFRYIAEKMGIQPAVNNYCCVPREIGEYFRSGAAAHTSMIDVIRREVENQNEV